MLKNDYFFGTIIWPCITSGSTPLDYLLGLKEALIYHGIGVSFEHLIVFHPSPDEAAIFDCFPFPLVALFLPAILVAMNRFIRIRSGG
jgi:hypothetical protein